MAVDELHDAPTPQKQPQVLRNALKTMDTTRKCSSLYGADHGNTSEALEAMSAALTEFNRVFERATCVFGDNEVIVNDQVYASSAESRELADRLRVRGVMAVTFVGSASVTDLAGFLAFLNVEPREIREEGSPSNHLRSRGVTRIVATDAIYSTEEVGDEEERGATAHVGDVDLAIAAAIKWLSDQESGEGGDSPRLPITEILSQPDMAARLIREAVTKLHASRRDYTDGELATEVVHDLKGLAASESGDWDKAAPQIRRAIAKLPKEMLPSASGFSSEKGAAAVDGSEIVADIEQIEAMVAEALREVHDHANPPAFGPSSLDQLFGARATGLLSNWRNELQPTSVILSSGATMETLMIWEEGPAEHGRIAGALAAMIARAVEMSDTDSAFTFAENLTDEMLRDNDQFWRRSNARSALRSVDTDVLRELVTAALESGDYRSKEIAAALVEAVPDLAVSLADLLGKYDGESFGRSLRRGVVESGRQSAVMLAELFRSGRAASRQAVIEVLTEISQPAATREIADAIAGQDSALAVCALGTLGTIRTPQAVEVCASALSHRDTNVRVAAVTALGSIGSDIAVEHLVRIVRRHSLTADDSAEKLAAIQALSRIGREEAIACLEEAANRTPLLGRGRYQSVKAAAKRAAEHIRTTAGRAA